MTPVEFEFFHKLFETVNLKFLVVLYYAEWRKIQNKLTQPFFNYWLQNLHPKIEEIATQTCNLTMQFAVAPIATISWKKLQPRVACNWNLQSMLFYNYWWNSGCTLVAYICSVGEPKKIWSSRSNLVQDWSFLTL